MGLHYKFMGSNTQKRVKRHVMPKAVKQLFHSSWHIRVSLHSTPMPGCTREQCRARCQVTCGPGPDAQTGNAVRAARCLWPGLR